MNGDTSSAEKRAGTPSRDTALLELRLNKRTNRSSEIHRYPRNQNVESTRLPVSTAQQRLWFIDQLQEVGAAYNEFLSVRLQGRLHQRSLDKALQLLVQRHEILRTTFVCDGGVPMQRIAAEGSCPLRVVDLERYEPAERHVHLQEHEGEEIRRRFDLTTGPLIRGLLLQLGAEECVLIITMHHIISDGWSMRVLIRELSELYSADVLQRNSSLPSLPVQYADFAVWQRDCMKDAVIQSQLSYWRTRLEGAAPELELPIDRPRPAAFRYLGDNIPIVLNKELSARVKEFARRHTVTTFITLLTAWVVLLSRLSGQTDVVVGTPVTNRRRPELEGLIGFFVSTLPLRVAVQGSETAAEMLRRVKQITLEAYENQDIAFDQIVEELRPQRSLSRHPIFQVVFALQSDACDVWELPGIKVSAHGANNETAKFDLTMLLEERGEEIAGTLNFDTDLFDRETMQRWRACFDTLLRSMLRRDTARIGELPLMPEVQSRQIFEKFGVGHATVPQPYLVHEVFEGHVEHAPDAVAVIYAGRTRTYGDINARANQLAHYLMTQGAQLGDYIPIIMQRSVEMLIAQIAVLKCGCAYVPIDPSLPAERQAWMIRDCGAPLVVTEYGERRVAYVGPARLLEYDEHDSLIAGFPTTNPIQKRMGRLAAYVMFTSGSTGTPKGVVVPHHAVNRLAIDNGYAVITSSDCIAHYSNPAFDASTFEIWGALLNGARLLIVPQEIVLEPRRFAEVLTQQKVTLLWMTVGLFIQYTEVLASAFEQLRYLIVGGDVVEPEVARRVLRKAPPRYLLNAYGPTECTTFSTTFVIDSIDNIDRSLPIGRPISCTQVYVLNSYLQAVPVGTAGDIYIGGAGVAIGYLQRPEQTADRFIPDPFGTVPGGRLYKSGDLGRWRADGNLEFLGRNDMQVKIRGFRVELGEIEERLVRYEGVKEAAVIIRDDAPDDKQIVAYVVVSDEGESSHNYVESLRAHVKAALPEYMVPAAFVILDRLPLTANGKVDRRALPAPYPKAYTSRQYETPQGEMEWILAGIWQSLLKVERVGRQDNFFELGGHSLLIIKLMERLREAGLSGEVRSVYEKPTLCDLASYLASATVQRSDVPPNLVPENSTVIAPRMLTLVDLTEDDIERIVEMVPGGAANVQDIYPLAPLQEGILFHHLLDTSRGDTYVLPRLFSIDSRKGVDDLVVALQTVIDRHDVLRTSILWEHLPLPVQIVHREARLPVVEMIMDENQDPLEQVLAWLRPERQRMDLREAPLMRLQVASQASGSYFVLLQLHHIVIDHVAFEAMTAEVMAHLGGRALLPLKAAPYREHVARVLNSMRTRDSEAFFRSKLGDVIETTAPFGLLDSHRDGTQIKDAYQALDLVLSQRLRMQARSLGVSPATLFHSAWGLVVAYTTGRNDVVFGSVLLGRLQIDADMQRTLGLFINTLPLRLKLLGISARDLVRQVQGELVELLSHEQASLSMAQRCSGVFGSTPLFSTLLNYRHSVPNTAAQWDRVRGMRTIASLERTNYPITLSIDDLDETFRLKAQTDHHVDPHLVLSLLCTATSALVQALEEAPDSPALALRVLPMVERQRVVNLFNATTTVPPNCYSVNRLFEQQTGRTPSAEAVVYENDSITYGELNAASNRLARYLKNIGIRRNDVVGICVDRSIDMVVGVLAIMKAGAAYMPLDPSYPLDRLKFMLSDSAPRLVLAGGCVSDGFQSSSSIVIDLSVARDDSADYDEEDLSQGECRLSAESLAYVLYTSGSTGQPKGVAMPHRAMLNLLQWHNTAFAPELGVRALQFAALSFDVAFQEIFSTLCSGGTLVLLDEWVRRDARALTDLLVGRSLQRLFVPPLMLQGLAEHFVAFGGSGLRLRDVVVAGEQLRITPEINAFFKELSRCRLHNHYGPTESHVVTATVLGGDPDQWPQFPSIGHPISNSQIYILDERQQPVPVGIAGEIYISGNNLAIGYLNRPELTAQRFIANPFGAAPNSRMYRTGDIGRWCADASIEYLGRNDDQVKVRGYRIEVGDVESQISRHRKIKEAAVVAIEDALGAKRLVAYVTARDHEAISDDELRTYLRELLPAYMVPSAFVVLDSLPLTPSGKLDRRALPEPEASAWENRNRELPLGNVEHAVARIWQEVLKVDQVCRQDNFFELGGHSLLVIKALTRLNQLFTTTLRVKDMYAAPTLRELAERLGGGAVEDELIDLEREAQLDKLITPTGIRPSLVDAEILVTGASGFVGRFLLTQLLKDTDATIYCVVRAPSEEQAKLRLKGILAKWGLWQEGFESRLKAIPGDLRLPRLGINDTSYLKLARSVDSIYHCATSMNHLETYSMAKQANVFSANELLKLATHSRPILINYISTLGVFSASQGEELPIVTERSSIDNERYRNSQGYLASKWVGEKIFLKAREVGVPCNIFRLGLVWADAEEGRFDDHQNVYMVLKSCLLSGHGIKGFRYPMPPTPVDYVARAVVCLANKHRDGRGIFHISSSRQTIEGVFERCGEIIGRPLELTSYFNWIRVMKQLHKDGRSMPAIPLIEYAFDMSEESFRRFQYERRSSAYVHFDSKWTQQELERAGIITPVWGDELLRVCLLYMISRDAELRALEESVRHLQTSAESAGAIRALS